jgi:putative FmdB family regulatory protein
MPLYEYKCQKCGYIFELLQKANDPPLNTCLRCGSPVKKILSPPALQFKGEGWYITDYAQKKNKKKEKAPSRPKEKKEKTAVKNDRSSTSE